MPSNRVTLWPKARGLENLPEILPLDYSDSAVLDSKKLSRKRRFENPQSPVDLRTIQFPPTQPLPQVGDSSKTILQRDPWIDHHGFFEEDQAGHTTLAYMNKPTFAIVAVKEVKLTKGDDVTCLRKTHHANVVNIVKFYRQEDMVFILYEDMDPLHVSLLDIHNTPAETLNQAEIASICRQMVDGLAYIHNELKISHGNINDSNVLLTKAGEVKIANIAQGMLCAVSTKEDDIRALGTVVAGLMARSNWGTEIQNFIQVTELASVDVDALSKHTFLDLSLEPSCLAPHVRIIAVSTKELRWSLAPK